MQSSASLHAAGGVAPYGSVIDAVAEALAGPGTRVLRWKEQGLKASRLRPVVRLDLAVAGATAGAVPVWHSVVVKQYTDDRGAATLAAMRTLWGAGFDGSDDLRITAPVVWLAPQRLLVQGLARGRLLHGALMGTGNHPEPLMAAATAGRWLAKLHGSVVPAAPVFDYRGDAQRASEQAAALAAAADIRAGHVIGDRVRALASALDGCLRRGPADGTRVPTHGDYQSKNVLTGGPRSRLCTTIDFDRFALASPARDLGHFLAQSATMTAARGRMLADARPWNDAFLAGYTERSPLPAGPDVASATVRSLVEILYYRLVVRPMPDASFVAEWLDECERHLNAVT